jgi:hypothetical protein
MLHTRDHSKPLVGHFLTFCVMIFAGYIAVELAGVFNGLGTDTSLFVRKHCALREFDTMISSFLDTSMKKSGRTHFVFYVDSFALRFCFVINPICGSLSLTSRITLYIVICLLFYRNSHAPRIHHEGGGKGVRRHSHPASAEWRGNKHTASTTTTTTPSLHFSLHFTSLPFTLLRFIAPLFYFITYR